jgi:phosphoglycerate dehydrogenase-like enzyme
MSRKILVTDTLFVGPDHEALLEKAGLTIARLPLLKASESELCEAIAGAEGYILGGIERVTAPVIEAATSLKVIAFTGAGFREFIPAHELATSKGIGITTAKGANSTAVARYTKTLILMMTRRIPSLTMVGGSDFHTAKDNEDLTAGVIGFGAVGSKLARELRADGFKVVVVSDDIAPEIEGFERVSVEDLPQRADIISVNVSKGRGGNVLSRTLIEALNKGTIVVNAAFPGAVDEKALAIRIAAGEIFAAFDAPMEIEHDAFPVGQYICSNAQAGYNTSRAIKLTSDMVTRSIINVLTTGTDENLVNR